MTDPRRKTDHAIRKASSNAIRTLQYQLRCLYWILTNYPTFGILKGFLSHQFESLFSIRTRQQSAEIETVRNRFGALIATRQFTTDWFDNNIAVWSTKLASLKAQHPKPAILEIGSFEGKSTLFLLTHLPDSHLTVVDMWAGDEAQRSSSQSSRVEQRFDTNVAEFKDRITKIRGNSAECLAKLLSGGPSQFDLIYVDGSHYADDVMIDATLSWQLLRQGGLMIFDDYLFTGPRRDIRKSTCRAINLFLRMIKGEHEIRHVAYQVMIAKTHAARPVARP
jgi:predicted O-methyltransferase YrrM